MTAAERLLAIAQKEVGVTEHPAGSNKVKYNTWFYGREVSGAAYPWCCVFVCWVFHQAGLGSLVRATGGCTTLMNWFKSQNRLVDPKSARPGDLVFYQFDTDAYADHIGIVERVTNTGVVAIEGNTSVTSDDNGGAVMRRSRKWNTMMAVARPDYERAERAAGERTEEGDEMTETRYQKLEELPQWAREDLQTMADRGVLQGDGKGSLDLSLDMVRLLVMMARLHRKENTGGEDA